MNLKVKTTLGLATVAAGIIPIATVISCGTATTQQNRPGESSPVSNNPLFKGGYDPFASGSNGQGQSVSGQGEATGGASSINLANGIFMPGADTVHPKFGLNRNDDSVAGKYENGPLANRIKTGSPIGEGISFDDLWNWQVDPTDDNTLHSGLKGENIPTANAPKVDNSFGMTDAGFDRATILEPRDSIFGSAIKPTQATLAHFYSSRITRSTATNIGFQKGMGSSGSYVDTSHLPYTTMYGHWTPSFEIGNWDVNWPSGTSIDLAHRYGVPMIGNVFFMNGQTKPHKYGMFAKPGPKKDYPIAKGLIELANFYGVDGWWIDWEGSVPESDIPGFMKALNSYAKTDKYRTEDGVEVDLAVEYAAQRTKYNYHGKKEQIIGSYYPDNSGTAAKYGDNFWHWQRHGGDSSWYASNAASDIRLGKDRYFSNGASNWGEDGQVGMLQQLHYYYRDSVPSNSGDQKNTHPHDFSNWWFSVGTNDNELLSELTNTYNGDPRVVDNDDKWALSNSFRETTSIVGRTPWATAFNSGEGLSLALMGSDNILDNTVGVSEDGWRNLGMQDMNPTYRWIMDFFNANDEKITDLSKNGLGKLANRPLTPFLNNRTKLGYFGGTTLDFKGQLPVGQSFDSRLYASAIPVQTNDKFEIKIRNNWGNNADRILPKFMANTINTSELSLNENDIYYASNGTEANPLHPNEKLGWATTENQPWTQRSKYLKYKKDVLNGKTKTTTYVEPTISSEDKNWITLSYDLSSLNLKTITDFGIRATSKTEANNITNLSLGEMRFKPHDEVNTYITRMDNFKTTKVWNSDKNFYQKARIQWDSLTNGNEKIESDKVRHYLVFYVNDEGKRTSLAWVGSTPYAYLDMIDKTKTTEKIEIVAIDDTYDVVGKQVAEIKLGGA